MARLKTNILDAGSGKIGNVVLYEWRGLSCMRTKPSRYKDKKSTAQLRQRQKMALVHEFLRSFVDHLDVTFYEEGASRSAYQSAQSYNLKYGIGGNYPNQFIDLSKALISKGDMPLPENLRMEKALGKIVIYWDIDQDSYGNMEDDELLLFWNLKGGSNRARCVQTEAKRSEGEHLWDLPSSLSMEEINVWAFFTNEQRTAVSNSLYLVG